MSRIPNEGLKLRLAEGKSEPPRGLNEQNPERGIETGENRLRPTSCRQSLNEQNPERGIETEIANLREPQGTRSE